MRENNLKLNCVNCESIIDTVADKLMQPLFLYDKPISFDELYNKVKKHPFTLSRIISCLGLFVMLVCIYFLVCWIIRKNIEFSYLDVIVIFLIFFMSIFRTIKRIKKTILKAVTFSNAKFYFYDEFVLIKEKNIIEMVFYNKLIYLAEFKDSFAFAFDSKNFLIKKNEIDGIFLTFLENLKNNYKKIKISTKSHNFFDCIFKDINNAEMICNNNKNKKTLGLYFNIKTVRRRLLLHYLCINFIKLHFVLLFIFLFLHFYPVVKFNFGSYIYFCSLILFLTIIYMKKYVEYESNIILNCSTEKIYFYDNFLFIKSDFKFCGYSYDNIKFIDERDDLIFIELESFCTPIIINKNVLNTNHKFFDNFKIHTTSK